MRFATVKGRISLATAAGYIDVAAASAGRFGPSPRAALDAWTDFSAWAADVDPTGSGYAAVVPAHQLGAPVPEPRQVFGIGLNYRDHVAESNFTVPEQPAVFTKFPSCLAGPTDAIVLPSDAVDWEVELVVVVGRRAERVSEDTAWSHVAGLTVGQDLSERRVQLAGPAPQFSLGKSFPGFAPTGPELVTIDELADPDDLPLGCELESGQVLQRGRTSDLVFAVPELIARLSAVCPLLPGDLIFTGTPAGVGGARKPPQFLRPGDVLISWVEGLGRLQNSMVAASAPAVVADPVAAGPSAR